MDTFYHIGRMNRFFAWMMVLIVVLVIYSMVVDTTPEWKEYQRQYHQLLVERSRQLARDPEYLKKVEQAKQKVKAEQEKIDQRKLDRLKRQKALLDDAYDKTLQALRGVDADLERVKVQLDMVAKKEDIDQARREYREIKKAYEKKLKQTGETKMWYRQPLLWMAYYEAKGKYEDLVLRYKKTRRKNFEPLSKEFEKLSKTRNKLEKFFKRLEKARNFLQHRIAKMTEEVTAAQNELGGLNKLLQGGKSYTIEIKQILLPHLEKVDRCTTCHLGIENPLMKGAPQPFGMHPALTKDFLLKHPFEKMGCTTCHMGQGRATTVKAAHGKVKHWEEPILPQGYLQIQCFQCHTYQKAPEGAEVAQQGYKLFMSRGCGGCHTIEGLSQGTQCPDLTSEGDKITKLYDFTRVKGEHTAMNWHLQHFLDPQKVSPDTIMPKLVQNEEEAMALTTFVLSLKESKIPRELRAYGENETRFPPQ